MMMRQPIPRGSKYGPWPESTFDYDLVSPLNKDTRPYPCGGKPKTANTATFYAGQDVTVTWEGSAVHGGGHCQVGSLGRQRTVDEEIIDNGHSWPSHTTMATRLSWLTPFSETA